MAERHYQSVKHNRLATAAALATLALSEFRLAEDNRYDPLLRKLGEFLLGMQRPTGDFDHMGGNLRRIKLLYYDGEATFALARLGNIFGDARYKTAAKRGLDWLTSTAYANSCAESGQKCTIVCWRIAP